MLPAGVVVAPCVRSLCVFLFFLLSLLRRSRCCRRGWFGSPGRAAGPRQLQPRRFLGVVLAPFSRAGSGCGGAGAAPCPFPEANRGALRAELWMGFFFFAGETGCVKIKQKTRKRRSSAELLGCDALPSCLFFFSSPHFAHSSGPTASPLSPSRERGGRIINIEALPSPGGSCRAGAARVTRRPRLLVATHPRVAVVAPRAPRCSPSAQYRDLALSGVAGAVAGCRMRPVLVWDFWLLKTVTNSKKSLPGGLTPSVRPQPLCSQGIASLEMVVVDFFFFLCVCVSFGQRNRRRSRAGRVVRARLDRGVRGCRALLPSPCLLRGPSASPE